METKRLKPFYSPVEAAAFFAALGVADRARATLKHSLVLALRAACLHSSGRGQCLDCRDELAPSAEYPGEYFHVHLEGGVLSLEWVFSHFCRHVFIHIKCVPDSEAECFFYLEQDYGVSGDMAEIVAWILENRPLVQAVCVEAVTA